MASKLNIKSAFVRNALALMTGTTIAQAIPVAIAPILTRIYTPDEFGLFAIYMGLITIGAVLATGRYENAILLPKKDNDAEQIVVLSMLLAFFMSIGFLLLILLFNKNIALMLGNSQISGWLYLTPLSVFLFSSYNILVYRLNRRHDYKSMSRARVTQSISISTLQIIIGVIGRVAAGLAVADLIGRLIAVLIIVKTTVGRVDFLSNKLKVLALAKRYKKFPIYEMPASLLNILSFQSVYLVLPGLFDVAVAGMYFLVFRVLMLPVALVGDAILDVFRNRATDDFNKHGSCRPIFLKTMKALFLLGVLPMLLIVIFGRDVFVFIFGSAWEEAGLYAQILAPMALLRFISAPLSYVFFVREKLQLDMILQMLFFVMTASSLFVGWYYSDVIILVALLSLSGCIFYIAQIVTSYRLSKA